MRLGQNDARLRLQGVDRGLGAVRLGPQLLRLAPRLSGVSLGRLDPAGSGNAERDVSFFRMPASRPRRGVALLLSQCDNVSHE